MTRYTYGVSEHGNPLGEAHHQAKLTDKDVELIRDIYEEGMTSYRTLARVFGVSKSQIRNICQYLKRADTPAAYKTDAEGVKKRPRDRLEQLGAVFEKLERD